MIWHSQQPLPQLAAYIPGPGPCSWALDSRQVGHVPANSITTSSSVETHIWLNPAMWRPGLPCQAMVTHLFTIQQTLSDVFRFTVIANVYVMQTSKKLRLAFLVNTQSTSSLGWHIWTIGMAVIIAASFCILTFIKIQNSNLLFAQKNGLRQSCCPLVVADIRGEVGCGYCWFFVFSFLSSPFCHYILYQQSPTPSIFCCYSPFSSQSFQISLIAVLPSQSRSSLTPLFLNFLGQRCISKNKQWSARLLTWWYVDKIWVIQSRIIEAVSRSQSPQILDKSRNWTQWTKRVTWIWYWNEYNSVLLYSFMIRLYD